MIIETLALGPLQTNCYILAVTRGRKAVIIDPGDEEAKIRGALAKHNLEPGLVVNTHGHYDHIGCDDKFGVVVCIHKDDAASLKNPELNLSRLLMTEYSVNTTVRELTDGERICSDGIVLEVIHTPGHTPGGISLLLKEPVNNIVFSGDTLFCGGVGRTDFPGASHKQLVSSIKKKLLVLDDKTIVLSGHGPKTTIAAEKTGNPFINSI